MINILFVHYGENWIRGSERCLIDLVEHLDPENFKPVVWTNNPTLANEFRSRQVQCVESHFSVLLGWSKPKYDVLNYLSLVKKSLAIIKQFDIHLIHANSGAPCQWLLPASRLRHLPLVCHLHSPYLFRDRMSLGIHFSDTCIGVSQAVIKDFKADNISHTHYDVIYNGIDITSLLAKRPTNIKPCLAISDEDFCIASIGSLIHRKGFDIVIRAVAKAREQGIPIKLIVIGDGPEKSNLIELCKSLNIDFYVHFLGERKDAFEILRGSADIFVTSPREEAFGLAIAEACLAKLPVIASNTGGVPEVIIDDETGVLFPSENVDALSQEIASLYRDGVKRNNIATSAHQRIEEYFSIEKNVQQFERLYRDSVNKQVQRSFKQDALTALSHLSQLLRKLSPWSNRPPLARANKRSTV